MKLFEPNINFRTKHCKSDNYLNCPKFIFNWDLFSLSRNIEKTDEQLIMDISNYLKYYNFEKPISLAGEIVKEFKDAKIDEFREININVYLNRSIEQIPNGKQMNEKFDKMAKIEKEYWERRRTF